MLARQEPGAGGAVTLQGQAPDTKAFILAFHLLTNQDAPEKRESKNETPTKENSDDNKPGLEEEQDCRLYSTVVEV